MGSVFEKSVMDVTRQKLDHVRTREPVCKSCNHDPLNRLTDELRAVDEGQASATTIEPLTDDLVATSRELLSVLERIQPGSTAPPDTPSPTRRLIPVTTT